MKTFNIRKYFIFVLCALMISFNIHIFLSSVLFKNSSVRAGDWSDYTSAFSGGDGTLSSPYLISSGNQFANMAKNYYSSSENFKLTQDISLQNHNWNISTSFTGCFDGAGYAINGLSISSTKESGGLFYSISGSFENVKFYTPSVSTINAGLIVSNNYGLINNIHISGALVTSITPRVGGIAYTNYGTISNCFFEGSVIAAHPGSYESFSSGSYSYKADSWRWDRAGAANIFTGTQSLYFDLTLKKSGTKTYNRYFSSFSASGISKSFTISGYTGTISSCVFIGSISSYSISSTVTKKYQQIVETDHEYSCAGNAYDDLNSSRFPSSPTLGSSFSDNCHLSSTGNFDTSSMSLISSINSVAKTYLYGSPISATNSPNSFYFNEGGFTNGYGKSLSLSGIKNWSNVSALGSAWAVDSKINNGYPHLTYFYWQDQA